MFDMMQYNVKFWSVRGGTGEPALLCACVASSLSTWPCIVFVPCLLFFHNQLENLWYFQEGYHKFFDVLLDPYFH